MKENINKILVIVLPAILVYLFFQFFNGNEEPKRIQINIGASDSTLTIENNGNQLTLNATDIGFTGETDTSIIKSPSNDEYYQSFIQDCKIIDSWMIKNRLLNGVSYRLELFNSGDSVKSITIHRTGTILYRTHPIVKVDSGYFYLRGGPKEDYFYLDLDTTLHYYNEEGPTNYCKATKIKKITTPNNG